MNVEELIHLDGVESYIIFSSIDPLSIVEGDDSESTFFIASLSESYALDKTLEGRTFTKTEQANGENVVIIPYFYHVLHDRQIGEMIEIKGESYEIIGIAPYMENQ